MENKNLKPFNLEAALRGEPVVTRDGRKVEEPYLFKECKTRFSLFMVVEGAVYSFTEEGRSIGEGDSPLDLFMAPKRVEYWVNVYRKNDDGIYTSMNSYSSEQEAKNNIIGVCIGQVKIWEEMI